MMDEYCPRIIEVTNTSTLAEINFPKILHDIYTEVQPMIGDGRLPDYIPQLAQVNPEKFGMAIQTSKGEVFHIGKVVVP